MRFKYDQETRERVIRMYQERRGNAPEEAATAAGHSNGIVMLS